MKKEVVFEEHAIIEYQTLPQKVKDKFEDMIDTLSKFGMLTKPEGDKINDNIFEMRVRMSGQLRGFYAYFEKDKVVVLRFFHKETQKTPKKEIQLCLNRLKGINNGRY
jgi:phage-related protein